MFMYPKKWCDYLIDIDIYCCSKFWLFLKYLIETNFFFNFPKIYVTYYFYSIFKYFHKNPKNYILEINNNFKCLKKKFWNNIVYLQTIYIMYTFIFLKISFLMNIYLVMLYCFKYLKSKWKKWIIINRVYKKGVSVLPRKVIVFSLSRIY